MTSNKLFGTTIDLAAKSLDLRARRHEMLLSNIANADTPGYKAFDVMIDEALARQLSGQQPGELQRTHPSHLPAGGHSTAEAPKSKTLSLSPQFTLRGDNNTVDMDREMSNLAANQLQYKASAQIVANKFKGLHDVIKGGGN